MGSPARVVLFALPLIACEEILDLDAYGPPHDASGGQTGAGGSGGDGGTLVRWHHEVTGEGERHGNSAVMAGDGSVYLAGDINGSLDRPRMDSAYSTEWDAFLVRLSDTKDVAWAEVYTSPGLQYAYDVAVDGQGVAYLGGRLNDTMNIGTGITHQPGEGYDGWLASVTPERVTNAVGVFGPGEQHVWGLDQRSEELYVAADNDGMLDLGGLKVNNSTPGADAVVFRVFGGGPWLDEYHDSAGGPQVVYDVSVGPNLVVAIGTASSVIDTTTDQACSMNGGGVDVLVVASTLEGSRAWSRCYGGPDDQLGWGVLVRKDPDVQEVLVVGDFSGALDFGAGAMTANDPDGYVAKLGDMGDGIWKLQFGGVGNQRVLGVAEDRQGELWVVGETYGDLEVQGQTFANRGGQDGFVGRLSQDGELLWAQIVGGPDDEELRGVAPALDSGVLVTGTIRGTVDLLGITIDGDEGADALVFELATSAP